MIRTGLTALGLVLVLSAPGLADTPTRPPVPRWQTDPATCDWHWREGGGIGLWAETCVFNDATWQVIWDVHRRAFVTQGGDMVMDIAVQEFYLPTGSGLTALMDVLTVSGQLQPEAPCAWNPIVPRPAQSNMAFHVFAPADPAALAPTATVNWGQDRTGEVPDPLCGPYGASSHGVRYFLTDQRWPDRAIFVEEGPERPLFDPSSITFLP
jgi:hypothetical protein